MPSRSLKRQEIHALDHDQALTAAIEHGPFYTKPKSGKLQMELQVVRLTRLGELELRINGKHYMYVKLIGPGQEVIFREAVTKFCKSCLHGGAGRALDVLKKRTVSYSVEAGLSDGPGVTVRLRAVLQSFFDAA